MTHGHSWNHVKRVENPADLVSRGRLPQEFVPTNIWRHGPFWLSEGEGNWPKSTVETPLEDLLERCKISLLVQQPTKHSFLFYRYSSFWRLLRITAFALRSVNRCRRIGNNNLHHLSTEELENTRAVLTKLAQREKFPQELINLEKSAAARSTSNT